MIIYYGLVPANTKRCGLFKVHQENQAILPWVILSVGIQGCISNQPGGEHGTDSPPKRLYHRCVACEICSGQKTTVQYLDT